MEDITTITTTTTSAAFPYFFLATLSYLFYIKTLKENKKHVKVVVDPEVHHFSQHAPGSGPCVGGVGDDILIPPIISPSSLLPRKTMTLDSPPSSQKKKNNNNNSSSQDKSYMCLTPLSSSAHLVEPLVQKINSSSQTDSSIVIGIAGGSGSGKTTLSRAIYESIGIEKIAYISHDSYYKDISHLPLCERERQNFDHPDSLDTALLVEHVRALKNKQSVEVPTYDYTTHSRCKEVQVMPAHPVILVEGILIFADPTLYELFDIRIFVDTDDDIRFIRRVQRDTCERGRSLEGVIQQYVDTVRPMHLQYVEPSKRNANIIVPVGLNSVALDLVVSKLKSHLAGGDV
eukprot:gene5473-6024_t